MRGECGMDRPDSTTSLLSTSMITPPLRRCSRQPSAASDRPIEVTYFGLPSSIAMPLRWLRSSAASLEICFGFQMGAKLCVLLTVARQQNSVLTKTMRPCLSMAMS
jgi:hypothetical protein